MDITTNTNITTTNNSSSSIVAAAAAAATIKTPEAETETPTRIQSVKPLSFSNGVLKRHQPLHHHHHHHHLHQAAGGFGNHHAVVVTYRECLKNHAASLGGHAVDGCGEFMPSPASNPTDPTSLKCAACGCHRNFHRREPEEPLPPSNATPALEYQPHHRHHPPPPPHRNSTGHSCPSSPSPPPISSSYYPSAPHMLLALSSGLSGPPTETVTPLSVAGNTGSSRKRFRTKFTQSQKDKMFEFAERVEWKMQKRDEELIRGFCNEVGVDKGVLKVWMHNNKNTLGKKDQNSNTIPSTTTPTTTNNTKISSGIGIGFDPAAVGATSSGHYPHHHHHHHDDDNNNNNNNNNNSNSSNSDDGLELGHHHHHGTHVVVHTNGSSSSS